ncbi:metallophosphoesterase family protein [Bradyrhizobium guangdongense]|uniref:metallophosphoesterase family protein n=1 Tax=Bradyrhizobium guangdongense TaxID=1325090 RepID=UPI001319DF0A|nr:metallophosphoesterase [Bradyrhizobium guangdongense]
MTEGSPIAQVLNRQFVIDQLGAVERQLEQDVNLRRLGGANVPIELNSVDYEAALDHISLVLQQERVRSSGQAGFDRPAPVRRRQACGAPIDDFVFMSHEPVVSIVQSALELYFRQSKALQRADAPDVSDDVRRGANNVPIITDKSLPGYVARRRNDRRLFDKFSITDPAWVSSLVAMGIRSLRTRHGFNPNPPESVRIDDHARVVLVGDWGSGIPRAQRVATKMRAAIEQARTEGREVHVIHLGDVYYSGWEYEYRDRFLSYWPVRPDESEVIGSWSLNGNHDMYSGGHAYFDVLLADRRFKRQGRASFFRLYNANWQLVGLDTAFEDNGLKDPQASWLSDTLARNEQKPILLTHHQLFSVFEEGSEVGRVLRQKLHPVLNKPIHSWFWGHEHRFVIYDPTEEVRHARLIGHGGVPVYMAHQESDAYSSPAAFEDRRFIENGLEHWAMLGFAVLDFEGPAMTVSYIDEFGSPVRSEVIS